MASWDPIVAPCEKGGRRVSDLADMSITLLVKWIFFYAKESDKLWSSVVCTKNGVDSRSLSISINSRSRRSTLVNLISFLLDKNANAKDLAHHGFKHLIGNGVHSKFWTENWTGKGELNELFLRIFT